MSLVRLILEHDIEYLLFSDNWALITVNQDFY